MSTNQYVVTATLVGKVALITGANSGIGLGTALELAQAGCHLVLACRNLYKAEQAVDRITGHSKDASVEILHLDLSDLDSVREAAAKFSASHVRLDILVNNAGIMATPYAKSAQGFDLQRATNHLGPFAFSGLVLPTLLETTGSRVVTVSSHMHSIGGLHARSWRKPSRLMSKWLTYGDTKLANLWFAYELQRRFDEAKVTTAISVAAHPGWAATNLAAGTVAQSAKGPFAEIGRSFNHFFNHFAQPFEMGALPSLFAATDPSVRGGEFYGPSEWFHMFGPAEKVRSNFHSRSSKSARQMWELSETLTGVHYEPALKISA